MLLNSLFVELKKIMLSLEIKYKHLGENLDTKESRYVADRYISCIEETDSFFSHEVYYVDAIKKSGMTQDDGIAAEYALKPSTIPDEYRSAVLREQRKYIIDNYEDGNDYFRMLSGLPDNAVEGHYAFMDFYDEYMVEFKPLHKFTNIEALQLRGSGHLQELVELFPGYRYMDFLGDRGIDPYIARKAANFQVLRSEYTGDSQLLDKFLTIYDQNREYVMTILYVRDFSTSKQFYDNYMALVTLIMTVQRVLADMFKSAIARDFYDIALIKILCECYNIPFIEGLPLDYQKLIAKNLNKLIYYKSTDKVLFDIADILGFDNSSIFKYYLVKNHRMDNDGKPIFDYIKDDKGQFIKDENDQLIENKDTMYDVYFQTVNILETNEEFALSDSSNKLSYESVTTDDPHWFTEDNDLLNAIYDNEFNYIDTKYLHMNVMFKLTEMLFEIVHVFRIMQDKREQSRLLDIGIPRILPNRKIDLYTFAMFMCAAIVKRNHLTGEIITAPSKTLYLMGFDFGKDLTTIKKSLEDNMKYVESNKIASFIYYTEMFTPGEVNNLFQNVRGLWEFLSTCLKDATTIESYRAYERIYRALYVTQDIDTVLRKEDGTMPETYLELLRSLDPELATIISGSDDDKLFEYLNHGIDAIKGIITDTKYLQGMVDSSGVLLTALTKMLRFFTSYTIDLKDFNIIYVLDHPYLNALKIIDDLKHIETDLTIKDTHLRDLMMEFARITSTMRQEDRIHLEEQLHMDSTMRYNGALTILLKLSMDSTMTIEDSLTLIDSLSMIGTMLKKDSITLDDFISYLIELNIEDKLIDEIVSDIISSIDIGGSISVLDVIATVSTLFGSGDIRISELMTSSVEIKLREYLTGGTKVYITNTQKIEDSLRIYDKVTNTIDIFARTDLTIRDTVNYVYSLQVGDMLFSDTDVSIDSTIQSGENLTIFDIVMNETLVDNRLKLKIRETMSKYATNTVQTGIPFNDTVSSTSNITSATANNLSDHVSIDTVITGRHEVFLRDEISIVREID